MNSRWKSITDLNSAQNTKVFSGGACNILNAQGQLLRNGERDFINNWLSAQNIPFFDPQIHPETHGCEYDYQTHHPLEMAARKAAKINLYEVSPRTFGAITSFEIAADHFQYGEKVVIYYSDGDPEKDAVPVHSRRGHPLFVPHGIHDNDAASQAHLREMVKNGNNMRKYLMQFARSMETLTVTFGNVVHKGDVIITPERIHAAELFSAVVRAASGERVFVNFIGGPETRDEKGNPMFIPAKPLSEIELHALLDQYVDEGNELRRAIAELVEISVFVRVVYTQKSAILALDELLKTDMKEA